MSLPAATTISRRTRQTRGTGFERLRALGLNSLQQTSGHVWTDHNLHDPGITMLEVLCYAISELAYRSEFPVADLLTGPSGQLDFESLALHPPQQALPCHATTLADHRRRLLDRVAGLDDVRLLPDRTQPGVLRLQVKPSPHLPAGAPDPVASVQRAWRAERPLGEDLAPWVGRVEDRLCALCATLEVSGSADPAEVLAEVFHHAAGVVDRAVHLSSRRELHERGFTLEQLHDGPVAEHGFTVAEHRGHADTAPGDGSHDDAVEMLYIDDISRELAKVPGVKAVLDLSLLLHDGTNVRSLTAWGGEGWALRLQVPGGAAAPKEHLVPAHLRPLRVKLQRRTHDLPVDAAELWRRVQDLRANARGQRLLAAHTLQDEERARLPTGRYRPPADYLSVQHHFPAVYGVGVHGVPDSYGKERQARALQLQAYLMLFDQVLANGLAQLSHVHELFSARGGGRKTQWWQVLGPKHVPGLNDLLDREEPGFEDAVLRPLDSSAKRKLRLLDHLLALHGEDLPQHAMRLHCAHLATPELDALLVRNKAAWLKDVVLLARQRAGGFDDRRMAWRWRSGGDAHNTSGLARRLGLLLGFEQVHARPLSAGLARHGWALGPRSRVLPAQDQEALAHAEVLSLPSLLDVPATPARVPDTTRVLNPLQWRAALGHDRYRLLPVAAGGLHRLFLGPDESGPAAWWPLGDFKTAAQARSAAHRLRSSLLSAHAACEGLHLVEHVLLRPVHSSGTAAAAAADPRWCPPQGDQVLRLTAVFPDWTLRTASPDFRVLAEETLRLNCPAHLVPRVVWLDLTALQAFEAAYRRWLVCRRLWLRRATDGRAEQLDRAAAAVLVLLTPPGGASS